METVGHGVRLDLPGLSAESFRFGEVKVLAASDDGDRAVDRPGQLRQEHVLGKHLGLLDPDRTVRANQPGKLSARNLDLHLTPGSPLGPPCIPPPRVPRSPWPDR